MEFKKFTSLDNTYTQKYIDNLVSQGLSGGLWEVSEKLDGANFSFWYDGGELKVASRNQFVDGTFFNCQKVVNKYEPLIKDWYHNNKLEGHLLVVYGELYGQGVQKRVEYGDIDFAVFDVVVDGNEQDYNFKYHFAKESGVPLVPLIKLCTFKEALEVDCTFKSLKTPEGFEGDNYAEGVTISPTTPAEFNSGSRVWFKNKSEKFSEHKKGKTAKKVRELSEKDSGYLNQASCYATMSRVVSAISKFGVITQKDFGRIQGEVMRDILEDFTKDTDIDLKLVIEDWKLFVQSLSREVQVVVREEFLKHI